MNRNIVLVVFALVVISGGRVQHSAAADVRENARENALESYAAFLQLAQPDDPRRPGALQRLADMELERAEALLIEGTRAGQAAALFASAVQRYRDLLANYPVYPGSDAVRYQLARALEALGDNDGARDELHTLVREYPDSELVGESAFREAESHFSAGRYQLATQAYARVIDWGEQQELQQTFLEQSWYKHGWALFKLADYELAQASFLKLLRHALLADGVYEQSRLEQLTPGGRELLTDALRAMSLSFSYGNGVADIKALLERDSAPGFEHLLFEDLGNLHRREERFHDAAETFRAYVAQYGLAAYAPHMQLAVIRTYEEAGFAEPALHAKEEFARVYAISAEPGSFWSVHDVAQQSDVVAALKQYLTELSRHYHAVSQATQATSDFVAAASWYRAWLHSFPDAPESAATHFMLAELLFDGRVFDAAVSAYEYAAYEYPDHPRNGEAGYAALLAYRAHAATLSGVDHDAWERRAIASGLKFSNRFPAHQFATAVQTDAAERLFNRGELEEALAAATALLAWEPVAQATEQHTAWLVSGHAWFDKQDFLRAEKAYQKALETDTGMATDAIVERLAAAVYKQAEAQQANGENELAARDYLRVARLAPTSTLVAAAQYEAASVFMDLGDYGAAVKVLEMFRSAFPQHELQLEVTRNLSVSYQHTGDRDKAAAEMMRLAKEARNDLENRIAANLQAIDLYRASHNTEQLLTSYVYLVNELGLPLDEDIDAREQISGLLQKLGNKSQQLEWIQSIIAAHERAGAAASPRSRTAAAQATLFFAEQAWAPFANVRLDEPLQDNLKLKTRLMETLLQKLGQAAAFGVTPITTAATFRMASAYAEMGNALVESERPASLSTQELEQYEFLLEEQAFPFEEQAIEVHENNTRRIADGIYDFWVRKSFDALGELMPGRYQKTEKGVSLANSLEE